VWEWLRQGRRIEFVVFLLGAFAFVIFDVPALIWFPEDLVGQGIIAAACLGFSLSLTVPALVYLRSQRRKQDVDHERSPRRNSRGVVA
jgi:hypothetical protein